MQEISEDVRDVEHKWLEQDGSAPFIETRRTPDIENMDLEQYHQSISLLVFDIYIYILIIYFDMCDLICYTCAYHKNVIIIKKYF